MDAHYRAALAACLLASPALADVELPRIFGDGMVLQQELPIALWGRADPGETVRAELRVAGGAAIGAGETAANAGGRWRIALPAAKATGESLELRIAGRNELVLRDLLLGEVWLCAGQSNMNREARVEGEHPEVRLFWIDGSTTPRVDDLGDGVAGWVPATPDGLASAAPPLDGRGAGKPRTGFAEVGWVFGRRVHQELGVPVGLIKCAFGGSQVEAWTPVDGLLDEYPADVAVEKPYVGHTPGLLYRSMVHGMVPLSIRGVLWYQGENNGRHRDYEVTLARWIHTWRELWARPDMPFYLVQIAPTSYAGGRMQYIWEAQSRVCREVEHTGLAPSNDIYLEGADEARVAELLEDRGHGQMVLSGKARPSNPHPPNKHLVAERLAAIALVETYGRPERPRYGPTYESHELAGDRIRVRFRDADGGLATRDGRELAWFELAPAKAEGEKRHAYVPAKARVVGPDTVEVWSEEVAAPVHVRFAWHCTAVHALVDRAGLPAVSFRTDRDDG